MLQICSLDSMQDSRPGNLIRGVHFCIESHVQVEHYQVIHLNLKRHEQRSYEYHIMLKDASKKND